MICHDPAVISVCAHNNSGSIQIDDCPVEAEVREKDGAGNVIKPVFPVDLNSAGGNARSGTDVDDLQRFPRLDLQSKLWRSDFRNGWRINIPSLETTTAD